MMDTAEPEKRGLWISILGALFMAFLGISFAILTSSDAVLLDGLFSLVGCVVGLVSLRVASLVVQPGDRFYHFGFAAFEPMLNLTKGLLMLFISLFALVSAVGDVLQGGREIRAGWGVIYALIAGTGCFAIAWNQGRLAKRTHSPLLQVDSKNWLIDAVLSLAVGIAFFTAMMLSGTRFDYLLPYADPVVVIVLVILSLPIPAGIIRVNWNQLLGRAPISGLQDRARELVVSKLETLPASEVHLRMQEIGRFTYIQVYVLLGEPDGQAIHEGTEAPIRLDKYRESIAETLSNEFSNLAIDVIFTSDRHWITASIGTPTASLNGGADASIQAAAMTEHQSSDATVEPVTSGEKDAPGKPSD